MLRLRTDRTRYNFKNPTGRAAVAANWAGLAVGACMSSCRDGDCPRSLCSGCIRCQGHDTWVAGTESCYNCCVTMSSGSMRQRPLTRMVFITCATMSQVGTANCGDIGAKSRAFGTPSANPHQVLSNVTEGIISCSSCSRSRGYYAPC